MKKLFIALAAMLMMAVAAPSAVAAPDDTFEELKKAGLTDDEILKAMIEIMEKEMKADTDSPIDALWVDDKHNAVVFSMIMDDVDAINGINEMPALIKPMLRNELFSDKDMKEFGQFVGKTGRSLDFFIHTRDEKHSAVISYSAQELLELK